MITVRIADLAGGGDALAGLRRAPVLQYKLQERAVDITQPDVAGVGAEDFEAEQPY